MVSMNYQKNSWPEIAQRVNDISDGQCCRIKSKFSIATILWCYYILANWGWKPGEEESVGHEMSTGTDGWRRVKGARVYAENTGRVWQTVLMSDKALEATCKEFLAPASSPNQIRND